MRATVLGLVLALATAFPSFAQTTAAEPEWRHASALSGEPKYPADFPHFEYVNPEAPKEGTVRLASSAGFDSFNPILGTRGTPAPGLPFIYETLMTPSYDEETISASYGLLAEAMRYPEDYSWVEYRLDPAARWHDGAPVTAEDVVFSLEAAKASDPSRAFYYRDVTGAEALDDRTVRFTFAGPGNRELPHIVGQLQVLPKHWWTGTDVNGAPRSIERTTLEPPLGSGPYKVSRFEAGRSVEYERVPDYWGASKNVNVGKNNFDRIRYEVIRDQTILLEAFRGDRYDFRVENSARDWATGYDFPAAQRGDVVKEEFSNEATGIMQAFVVNLRRPKFQDERVRRALNLMYDFESQRDTIFYGQYDRINSFFFNTDLASSGLPEGRELQILEEVRDLIPAAVFMEPYQNPVNGTPERVRDNAREAVRLFREAGYELRNGRMVNAATGEPFTIEVLEDSPSMERVILPYQQSLARIGVELQFRPVDSSQLQNRLTNFDFDMTVAGWAQSLSPGNEQLDYWGSAAADRPGSQNYAGIKDPGIDALIEKVIFAEDRDELVAATRALDRVLLHHDYVIPQYSSRTWRTARWNRFGHPDTIPPYNFGFPTIWWWDEEKASKIGSPS